MIGGKIVLAVLMFSVLLFGCCMAPSTTAPLSGGGNGTQNPQPGTDNAGQDAGGPSPPPQQNHPTGDGVIIDVGGNTGGGNGSSGGTAATQQDCATMTGSCAQCVAKQGCGWCKSSNSCFIGDAGGPDVSSCQPGDWTVTEAGCATPAGGSSCTKQTNCAFCLSGSGCKWCIQGSRCVDASSTDACTGGWLTQSFQCNYASR